MPMPKVLSGFVIFFALLAIVTCGQGESADEEPSAVQWERRLDNAERHERQLIWRDLLGRGGSVASIWIELIHSESVTVATEVQDHLPNAQRSLVDELTRMSQSKDDPESRLALKALALIGEQGRTSARDALRSKGHSTRLAAADGLSMAKDEGLAVAEAMIDVLERGDRDSRLRALLILTRQGPQSAPALSAVLKCLRDAQDGEEAVDAARAVGSMGPSAARGVGDLISALDHEDREVRWAAQKALGDIGPAAKAAVTKLEKAVGETCQRGGVTLESPAARSLLKIRGE